MTAPLPIDGGAGAAIRPDRLPGAGTLALVAVGAAMATTALLPRQEGWLAVLVLVIALGVPHGALDGEVAGPLMRPRFGRWWFPVFAVPYLGLSALVLVAWRLAPEATLAAFLALSVWHFGEEDAGPGEPFAALVRGGVPVMLPVLLHPTETARLFAVVTGVPMPAPPGWWLAAAWLWFPAAGAWLALRRPPAGVLAELAGLALAFLVLPPLSAFGLYFVCLHGPRHMRALADHPVKAPAVTDMSQAALRSLPVFGLTLVLGLGLWPAYAAGGEGAVPALLALTLQGLSALTLPHVLLDRLADAHASVSPPPGSR